MVYIIKYRSFDLGSNLPIIMRVMALFQLQFLQNALVQVKMAPGRRHLCHIDTFLVIYFFQNRRHEMSSLRGIETERSKRERERQTDRQTDRQVQFVTISMLKNANFVKKKKRYI